MVTATDLRGLVFTAAIEAEAVGLLGCGRCYFFRHTAI